jgi:hypothetical protein
VTTRTANSAKTEKSNAIKTARSNQLAQIREIVSKIKSVLKNLSGYQKSQLALLESVSFGLYDEIDKLSKKAPAEPITELVLAQINDVVKESKSLTKHDPYMQKLQEFVAAGDNPQHRDAVVVMRQVRQGLGRFKTYIDPAIDEKRKVLSIAQGIEHAIGLYLSGQKEVGKEDLGSYFIPLREAWIIKYNQQFDFDKLDMIDLAEYFEITNE